MRDRTLNEMETGFLRQVKSEDLHLVLVLLQRLL